jgi:hypothetical protein
MAPRGRLLYQARKLAHLIGVALVETGVANVSGAPRRESSGCAGGGFPHDEMSGLAHQARYVELFAQRFPSRERVGE